MPGCGPGQSAAGRSRKPTTIAEIATARGPQEQLNTQTLYLSYSLGLTGSAEAKAAQEHQQERQ